MHKDSKIYVAGHDGLVGSSIVKILKGKGYSNLVFRKLSELNLVSQSETEYFFKEQKPDYVFLAAAKVGGIHANNTYPAEFIYNNLAIQTNVIEGCRRAGVKKLCFLGSVCIYPKYAPVPVKEEYLLTGHVGRWQH